MLGAATFFWTSAAFANPPDTFGFGSRSTALAGAVSADATDVSANYYNPAGIVGAKSFSAMVGYFRVDHHLALNGQDTHVDPVRGINAGFVIPGRIRSLPVAIGLALHLPDDRISRVRALRQEQPRWELYDNRNQRLYLAANVAIRPFSWLEIGGGVSFMSSTRGRLDITGKAEIFSPQNSSLRHEVDADLTAIRYPQVGVRVHVHPRASLAVVYRAEFQLGLDLDARLYGDVSALTTAYYQLATSSVNAFLPRQLVFGGSWRVRDDVRVNADLTWVNWSAYVPPVAQLNVDLNIPPPAGGWPAGISAPTTPAPITILPIGMRDRLVPRLGFEWNAFSTERIDLLVRGGYEYAKSPIPRQTGTTNYVDLDRHSMSAGLGVQWHVKSHIYSGTLSFDTHLQWSELVSQVFEKNNPADFIGDYRASGHILNYGASIAAQF